MGLASRMTKKMTSRVASPVAIRGGVGVVPNFYVDSVNGDDGNDGLTAETAFETLSAVEAALVAGNRYGLARGSLWFESIDPDEDSLIFQPYGTGDIPVIDGSQVVDTWTQPDVGTYPDVWAATVSRAIVEGQAQWQFWADGVRPARQTSLANLQSSGGWHYASGQGLTTSTTIYIKSTTDPNTSGVEYRASDLSLGIAWSASWSRSDSQDIAVVGPLEIAKFTGHNGSLSGGNGSYKKLLLHGCGHHHAVVEGTGEDIVCLDDLGSSAETGFIPYVVYRDNGAGLTPKTSRLFVVGTSAATPGTSLNEGFYSHTSGVKFGVLPLEQCAFKNIKQCMTHAGNGIDTQGIAVDAATRGIYFAAGITGGAPERHKYWQVRNIATNGFGVYDAGTAGSLNFVRDVIIEHCTFHTALQLLAMFRVSDREGVVTIRNCTFLFDGAIDLTQSLSVGTSYSAGIGLTVNFTDNVIVRRPVTNLNQRLHDWRSVSNLTLNFDRNLYLQTSQNFTYRYESEITSMISNTGGGVGNHFAAWQALGFDENSLILTQSDIATVLSTYFEGDPFAGDVRLKDLSGLGTFGDGSALNNAGPQYHWDWNARAVASGAPTTHPAIPETIADGRIYINDPTAWDFYP